MIYTLTIEIEAPTLKRAIQNAHKGEVIDVKKKEAEAAVAKFGF